MRLFNISLLTFPMLLPTQPGTPLQDAVHVQSYGAEKLSGTDVGRHDVRSWVTLLVQEYLIYCGILNRFRSLISLLIEMQFVISTLE
jgi:hypothetical protein